jgi:hypothetical protein
LQVFKVDKNKMMELILVIGIIFIICLGLWLKKLNDNYIDEYNKRYIEKIKQNVARSLVNPYRD